MKNEDKEAFEKFFTKDYAPSIVWQAACEYKQKEIDELKDRLHHEVEMIDGAAKDHIEKLQAENERLKEVISYQNSYSAFLHEKEMAQKIQKLQAENAKLKECLKEIANEDFRGNRSRGSVKAYLCLKELDENL